MNCKLYILDEINVGFEGLSEKHIKKIIKNTKLLVKGAHMTPAFKMKLTDGKESNFSESGHTFFYMLNKVIPMVEKFGYEIEVEDLRETLPFIPKKIDKDFISYTGIELYYYQVKSTNEIIDNERGLFEIPTSGGKGLLSATIAKVYDFALDFIIIVPTEKLVKQIKADFENVGLEIGAITKGFTEKQKAEQWKKKHVVCTWRLVNNNRDKLERFKGFVYDEAHVMGDVMYSVFENELSHALIRVGMTGTIPTDKLKREKLFCHIGGDVLIQIEPHDLQEEGYISTCDIEMYPIEHKFKSIGDWDWNLEESYLSTNKKRLKVISEMIDDLPETETTLILCSKDVSENLSVLNDLDVIHGNIKESVRETYYKKLETVKGYKLLATFDTVGTGTSIDEITTIFAIDMGKNDTRIIQGIGRGLRKDGKTNHLKVIDVYSKLSYHSTKTNRWREFSYSGSTHVNRRKKLYKELKYPFKEMNVRTIYDGKK